jgi:ribosomal protein L12E/L44/L45/RPP1/RPP2
VGQSTHDKFRYAQALLSHQVPSGDMAEVLDRALDALIDRLEKRKFAATDRPRPGRRRSTEGGRYVPAHVKRTVWTRDGGQCTFVSEAGHRCSARTFLEFDHINEVARGGGATADSIRLRCRAHNQFGAECTFGREFMNNKREGARCVAKTRAQTEAAATAHAAKEAQQAKERDVIPWLRQLGLRADEARRAAAHCEAIPDATLEERVRLALSHCCSRAPSRGSAASILGTGA